MGVMGGVENKPSGRASEILSRCGTAIAPPLRDAVAQLADPELRTFVEYHLGWRDSSGAPIDGRAGKGLRGAVALIASQAVGGSAEAALPGAVAVELMHNFSLLHDDIMDGDRYRRGRETVWSLHGLGWGVLTGDALLVLATQQLSSLPNRCAVECTSDLLGATAKMIHGQAEDMRFERRVDVSLDECLSMARRKTGALLGCAASLGARLGGARPDQLTSLEAFGRELGMVFQATDDLLGVWGEPTRTGKPVGSDIATRKKSIPISAAIASQEPSAATLKALLEKMEADHDDLLRAVGLVEECGGRVQTMELIDVHLHEALSHLHEVELDPDAADDLRALLGFASSRDS
jgi:geranylgeranyl diphosphate synthase type I